MADPWEIALKSCFRCIDETDAYIRNHYHLEPDYDSAYYASGYENNIPLPVVVMIPMKSSGKPGIFRRLLKPVG